MQSKRFIHQSSHISVSPSTARQILDMEPWRLTGFLHELAGTSAGGRIWWRSGCDEDLTDKIQAARTAEEEILFTVTHRAVDVEPTLSADPEHPDAILAFDSALGIALLENFGKATGPLRERWAADLASGSAAPADLLDSVTSMLHVKICDMLGRPASSALSPLETSLLHGKAEKEIIRHLESDISEQMIDPESPSPLARGANTPSP